MQTAIKESFIKLDPRVMVRNPVMFTVEVGTVVMAWVTVYSYSHTGQGAVVISYFFFVLVLTWAANILNKDKSQ